MYSQIDKEEQNRLIDAYQKEDIFIITEKLINKKDLPPSSKKNYLDILDEISNRNDLRKEIWYGRGTWYDPAEGYLALVDNKNVMRYKLVLSSYSINNNNLEFLSLTKDFQTKNKATYQDLTSKKSLESKNFIFQTYDTPKLYYEDETVAYEITAKSFFENEKDYSLKGKIDKEFGLLIFEYEYEIPKFRGASTTYYITCATSLRRLEAKILETFTVFNPS